MDLSNVGSFAIKRFIDAILKGKIQLIGVVKSDLHTIFGGEKGEKNYAAFLEGLDNYYLFHNGEKKTVLQYLEEQMALRYRTTKGVFQHRKFARNYATGFRKVVSYLEDIPARYREDSNTFFHSEAVVGLVGHPIIAFLMKGLADERHAGPQAVKLAKLLDKARRKKGWRINRKLTLSYAYDLTLKGAGNYAVDHIIALEREDGKLVYVAIQDKVITNAKDFFEKEKTMNRLIANDMRKLYQWLEGLFDEMIDDHAAKRKDDTANWGKKGLLENAAGGMEKRGAKLLKAKPHSKRTG